MGESATGIENPVGQIPEKSRIESRDPAQAEKDYRAILEFCFDNEGRPKTEEHGFVLFEPFKYSPDQAKDKERKLSASIQAALLGLRPLFIIERDFSLILRSNQEFGNKLELFDKSENFKKYHSSSSLVFDPKQAEQVMRENPDLFGDYKAEQPLGEYLADKIRIDQLREERDDLNDPHLALLMVDPDHPDEEGTVTFGVRFTKIVLGSGEYWTLQTARRQALQFGVLLGYPRTLLEKSVDRKWERMVRNVKEGRPAKSAIYHYPHRISKIFYFEDIEMGQKGEEFKEKVEAAFRDSAIENTHQEYMFLYDKSKKSLLSKASEAIFGVK